MNHGNNTHFDAELAKAKIFAEIMQMLADMRKKDAETVKVNAEADTFREMRNAEIAKLMAETANINKQTYWYPLLVASGLIGAIAAVVKLFF